MSRVVLDPTGELSPVDRTLTARPASLEGKTVMIVGAGKMSELSARHLRRSGASHIFEAYTSPADILQNQKRQMIGQTVVHILVDKYLKSLPAADRTPYASRRWPSHLESRAAASTVSSRTAAPC